MLVMSRIGNNNVATSPLIIVKCKYGETSSIAYVQVMLLWLFVIVQNYCSIIQVGNFWQVINKGRYYLLIGRFYVRTGRYHLPTRGITCKQEGITYLQVGITYLQVIPRAICGVIKCKISDLVSFHHRTLCYSYLIDNLFLLLLSKHFKADVPQTDNRPNSIYANDIQAQNKFLYMGQSRPLFCLFSSLSHSNSKYSSISTK